MGKKNTKKNDASTIARNKKARHEYALEEHYEAGLSLLGWEVKSLRESKADIAEARIIIKRNEAYLLGANFTPLSTASSHITPQSDRTRKLLLNRKELTQIEKALAQKGMTCVPTSLFWKRGNVKLNVALARGKKDYDKRRSEQEADWKREKAKIFKHMNR